MQSKDFRGVHHPVWKRWHCSSHHTTCCLETYQIKGVLLSSGLKLVLEEKCISLPTLIFFFSPAEVVWLDFRAWNQKTKKLCDLKGMGWGEWKKSLFSFQVGTKWDLHLAQFPLCLQQLLSAACSSLNPWGVSSFPGLPGALEPALPCAVRLLHLPSTHTAAFHALK